MEKEEITSEKFFEDIQKETNIENIQEYLENRKDIKIIIPILQKINEYFLRNCEIHIGDLIIKPIETEIYFANESCHGACHENDRQKQPFFGKLYFHRYKNNSDKFVCISTKTRGGVDVCISKGDYFLSILIRSAYFNSDKEPVVGTRKVVDKILNLKNNNIENLGEEKKIELIEQIEKSEISFIKNNDNFKKNIMKHCRIKGNEYFSSYNELKKAELNCFIKEDQENLAKKNNIYKDDNFKKK